MPVLIMKISSFHIYAGLLSAFVWCGSVAAYADGIHDAVRAGDVQKVEAMLSAAPNMVNSRSKGRATPLHLACLAGRVDMVKALLRHRAAVDPAMEMGFTPLHCAIVFGSIDLTRLLMDAGADVNAATDRGYTCLHMAVKKDAREIARILLARGADPGSRAKDNSTPLSLAKDDNLVEMTAILKTRPQSATTISTVRPKESDPGAGLVPARTEFSESVSQGDPERRFAGSPAEQQVEKRLPDGSTYRGEMRNGNLHGYGVLVFRDGERYEGYFVDGQKHGTGLTSFSNGEQYKGEWRQNKKNGFGSYIFPDGEKYEGQWREGQMHGRGVYTYSDGRMLDGYWQENRFVTDSRK